MGQEPAHRLDPAHDELRQELHSAIDAFGGVLGAMSGAASSEIGVARLAAWQRHILVLEPAPGSAPDTPVARRAWARAGGAAVDWVHDEAGERERRNGELQDTLWEIVKGITQTLTSEAASDAEAEECIDRLRAAFSMSPDELRQAVTEAVGRLAELLERRRKEHDEMAAALGQRIHALSSDLETARREADLDALTQVANRGVFDREVERAVDLQALTGDAATLVLVDLDHFKEVNDRHGHRVGDEALRAVATELVRAFPRRSDLVARYGGDEFAVLLLNARVLDAERLVGRLRARLSETDLVAEPPIRLSVTAGIAALRRGRTVTDVLEAADRALYAAKSAGRGCARIDASDEAESPTAA